MKKIILVCLIFVLIIYNIHSQDTNTVKYLPLKVGNCWIYNWGGGKQKILITGFIITNGHIYYQFSVTGPACSPCPIGIPSPYLMILNPIRVDSSTGNIMMIGSTCPWYNGEILVDSLKRTIGNEIQNTCNGTYCIDTSEQSFFGIMKKTKQLGYFTPISNWSRLRRYAIDFGLVRSDNGCGSIGTCSYILLGCVINGTVFGDTSSPTSILKISTEIPEHFSLCQNYPNPFNPTTKIKFSIPFVGNDRDRSVMLAVYDALGREVQTLVNEQLHPGSYEVEFIGTDFSSGIYYYTLTSGEYIETKKMIFLK